MRYRDVAQLVARLVWDQDVAGSNPVIPTKKPTGRSYLPIGFFIEITDAEPLHFAEMENLAL